MSRYAGPLAARAGERLRTRPGCSAGHHRNQPGPQIVVKEFIITSGEQKSVAKGIVVRRAPRAQPKDVSLELPRDSMIVFTGLSGSGKSSLAFDTIFAEGQRRYVESLSAYARQFLGQMDKPDVDFIDGLSPAVSIDQKAASRNPRLTVGTITEVYDYLRLLYARVGKPHCPLCGRPIARQAPQQIVDRVLELEEGARFQVLAPVIRGRKGEYGELLRELQAKGYSRARVDGTVIRLDSAAADGGGLPALRKYEKHTIEVVVDRLAVKADARRRLTDSVETALALSGGVVLLDFTDLAEDDPHRERMYSEHLACLYDDLSFEELEPRSFSFNSPWGACPDCTGLGTRMEVNPALVVPDPDKTLAGGAIGPWSGGHVRRLLHPADRGPRHVAGIRPGHALARLPAVARHVAAARATSSRCMCTSPPPGAGNGPTTRCSRARSRSSSGGTPRRRVTPRASGSRASCARCPARRAREPGSSPSPGP